MVVAEVLYNSQPPPNLLSLLNSICDPVGKPSRYLAGELNHKDWQRLCVK